MKRFLLGFLTLGFALLTASAARAQDTEEEYPGLIGAGGILLFYHTQAPLSYMGMTRKEAPPGSVPAGEVKGVGCQYGLSIPIGRSTSLSGAAGQGGYQKAVGGIMAAHPELVGIFDVRVDMHTFSILRVYTRLCVEVTAQGLRRAASR